VRDYNFTSKALFYLPNFGEGIVITKHEVAEVSFIFVVIGALLAALAMALALIWQPLP